MRWSPSYDDSPTELTSEMEAVIRRKNERLASSDSEGYSSSASSTGTFSSFGSNRFTRVDDCSDSYDSEDSNDSAIFVKSTNTNWKSDTKSVKSDSSGMYENFKA